MFLKLQYVFSKKENCTNFGMCIAITTLLLLLFVVPSQSQIIVCGDSTIGFSFGKRFFDTKNNICKGNSILSILTHETSVQQHDGKDVYRDVRDVEYTIKEKKGVHVITRKVMKEDKALIDSASEETKKFIDLTSELQSTLLTPRKIKEKALRGGIKRVVGKVMREDDITRVVIDKMASVKDEYTDKDGKVVLVRFFGSVTEMTEAKESLSYSSLSDKLYIDDLKAINTIFCSVNTKKNGERVEIRNIENIEIVKVKY